MANDTWFMYAASTAGILAGGNSATAFYNGNNGGGTVVGTTEANEQSKLKAGTIDKLRTFFSTATATASTTTRGRLNGVNGNIVATETSGATGEFEDVTHSDTIADGDLYTIAGTGPGLAQTSNQIGGHGFHYAATSVETLALGGITRASSNTAAGNFFSGLLGGGTGSNLSSTESTMTSKARAPGTFSFLRSNVTVAKSGATWTFNYRANSLNGNGTTSYASGATGIVEDTTHSDTIASGDILDIMNTSTAATVTTVVQAQGLFLASAHLWDTASITTVTNGGSAGTFYVLCGITTPIATEANAQHRLRFATVAQKMRARVDGNPTTGFTFTSRKNTAAGNQTMVIGSAATGAFEDTTHTDTIVAGDLLCIGVGTSTSNNSQYNLMLTFGVTSNGATISQGFGPLSQSLAATANNALGISQTFGPLSQALTATSLPKETATISQGFAGLQTFIAATEAGTRGSGIRRFWTF